MLRFAHVVGPTAAPPLNALLQQPMAATLLGFDPQMQIIHEEDVVNALEHAVGTHDGPAENLDGAVNIGAYPPLPLARLLRTAGVIPFPVLHPLAYRGQRIARLVGGPIARAQRLDWDNLRYPAVGDTARMRDAFGFVPTYETDAILSELIERAHPRGLAPGPPHACGG